MSNTQPVRCGRQLRHPRTLLALGATAFVVACTGDAATNTAPLEPLRHVTRPRRQ
jgi:hypothetical protein